MKALEALERLRPKTTNTPYYTKSERRYYCDIIEKSLKENQEKIEVFEENIELLKDINQRMSLREHKNNNKLKALEIIKHKTVDIWRIQNEKNVKEYNLMVGRSRWLTLEEYDLVKEVLN